MGNTLNRIADQFKFLKDVEEMAKILREHNNKYHMVAPDGKQWIDLDIDNLPDRFFTRDDIKIKEYFDDGSGAFEKNKNERHYLVNEMIYNNAEYLYRIIEKKEPIRITKDILDRLSQFDDNLIGTMEYDGHKVEVIDD